MYKFSAVLPKYIIMTDQAPAFPRHPHPHWSLSRPGTGSSTPDVSVRRPGEFCRSSSAGRIHGALSDSVWIGLQCCRASFSIRVFAGLFCSVQFWPRCEQ